MNTVAAASHRAGSNWEFAPRRPRYGKTQPVTPSTIGTVRKAELPVVPGKEQRSLPYLLASFIASMRTRSSSSCASDVVLTSHLRYPHSPAGSRTRRAGYESALECL